MLCAYRAHIMLTLSLQAPADRRQGRSLRAKGSGPRVRARPVGVQVRGDGQEVHRGPKGAGGPPERDWQHLRVSRTPRESVDLPILRARSRCLHSITEFVDFSFSFWSLRSPVIWLGRWEEVDTRSPPPVLSIATSRAQFTPDLS